MLSQSIGDDGQKLNNRLSICAWEFCREDMCNIFWSVVRSKDEIIVFVWVVSELYRSDESVGVIKWNGDPRIDARTSDTGSHRDGLVECFMDEEKLELAVVFTRTQIMYEVDAMRGGCFREI